MIIFDLDGTLADPEHRRHLVDLNKNRCPACKPPFASRIDNEKLPCPQCGFNAARWRPDWQKFFEECEFDKPIKPVVAIWDSFETEIACDRADLAIWSGRCESVKQKTLDWLSRHLFINNMQWLDSVLKMRPKGNSMPDDELKEMWLDDFIAHSAKEIEYVFDDRPKVVRMWRKRGIFVFNCHQSEEEF